MKTIWLGLKGHPGTEFIVFLLFMGAFAGRAGGARGAIGGACLMATVFLPVYLYGAYQRGLSVDNNSGDKNV